MKNNKENSRNSDKLAFLHMSKCAGRAFQELLCENYSNNCEFNNHNEIENTPTSELISFDLLYGHMSYYNLRNIIQYGFKTIAIFRNPIERTLSEYNHLMTMENKIEESRIMRERKFTFFDFVTAKHSQLALWVNDYLSVLGYNGLNGYNASAYYEKAYDILTNKLDFIGIFEHLDETVSRLKKRFGLKGDLNRIGVTKNKIEVSNDEIKRCIRFLGPDIVLYNTAKWMFENEEHY